MEDNELPGWTFTVQEVSAGVYRGHAEDHQGRSVELTRTNPDEVLRLLRERALDIVARGG